MENTHSPVPVKIEPVEVESRQKTFDFCQAMSYISQGKMVTKLEWKNPEFYGVLNNSIVKLHKPDGKLYAWTICAGDIAGTDYVIKS